jgi:tryptophan synthase alpha subunit
VYELRYINTLLFLLGIPFTDPLADGPTVQYASNVSNQYNYLMRE